MSGRKILKGLREAVASVAVPQAYEAERFRLVALEALTLLLEMERAGALRLPFAHHAETVASLREVLGVKGT